MFSGSALFEMKATHGLPLDFALDLVREDGRVVKWDEFIEQARTNGWFDFQTYREMEAALRDAGWPEADEILFRTRLYMMRYPHA